VDAVLVRVPPSFSFVSFAMRLREQRESEVLISRIVTSSIRLRCHRGTVGDHVVYVRERITTRPCWVTPDVSIAAAMLSAADATSRAAFAQKMCFAALAAAMQFSAMHRCPECRSRPRRLRVRRYFSATRMRLRRSIVRASCSRGGCGDFALILRGRFVSVRLAMGRSIKEWVWPISRNR